MASRANIFQTGIQFDTDNLTDFINLLNKTSFLIIPVTISISKLMVNSYSCFQLYLPMFPNNYRCLDLLYENNLDLNVLFRLTLPLQVLHF